MRENWSTINYAGPGKPHKLSQSDKGHLNLSFFSRILAHFCFRCRKSTDVSMCPSIHVCVAVRKRTYALEFPSAIQRNVLWTDECKYVIGITLEEAEPITSFGLIPPKYVCVTDIDRGHRSIPPGECFSSLTASSF